MNDADDRIERYVAGEMAREERLAFEAEILADPALADALYADVSAAAAIEIAARARRERAAGVVAAVPWWRRSRVRILTPIAAAAAIVVAFLVTSPPSPGPEPAYRGAGVDTSRFHPQGTVASTPARFTWERFGEASVYRFELYDETSRRVHSEVTAGTTIEIAPDVSVPAAGHWMLTPLDDVRIPLGDAVVIRYHTAR